MTERSYFWDGLVTGDATLAPYTSNLWNTLYQNMFSRGNNEGYLTDFLNELVVAGVSGGVTVASGGALVDGSFYENTNTVSVSIPTPVSDPRIDRIVVQKDWVTQTIRVARVAGTENASPTAPALTQTADTLWEIPLAQALITTAGVITVTNEREFVRTRLAPLVTMEEIETLSGDGVTTQLNFSNIPANFKHLLLVGNLSINVATALNVFLNNDTNLANYSRSLILRFAGAVAASANTGGNPLLILKGVGSERLGSENTVGIRIYFANYKDTVFYKTAIATENELGNDTVGDFEIGRESGLWKNTAAISTINLQSTDIILEETRLTLYGFI